MYENLKLRLSKILKQEVDLLVRGQSSIAKWHNEITPSWLNALNIDSTVSESIANLWRQVDHFVPSAVSILQRYVVEIGLVVFKASSERPKLMYLFEGPNKHEYYCWVAGAPALDDNIKDWEFEKGIRLPQSYQTFLKVHDGFLREGLSESGIRTLDKVFILSAEESPVDNSARFDNKPLLGFSGNSTGDEQCFDFSKPFGDDDFLTVRWDHETRQIYKPQDFWKFLDALILNETYSSEK